MTITPEQRTEYCCQCGDLTGRAGRGEDSIYVTILSTDQEVGPLCESCYDKLRSSGDIQNDE